MPLILALAIIAAVSFVAHAQPAGHDHSSAGSEEGLGRAHMDTSCSPSVAGEFDRALALLHNFWYARAFERFNSVAKNDPGCAIAYWGAAMTYNHPFWDPPSQDDETAAWILVQKGMAAQKASARDSLDWPADGSKNSDAFTASECVQPSQRHDRRKARFEGFGSSPRHQADLSWRADLGVV